MTNREQSNRTQALTGYIMAGGASSRFGADKALVRFGERRMLDRMIDLMRCVTPKLKLVAPGDKYIEFGIETVADRWPGEGPLGGIITALLDAAADSAQTIANQQSRVSSDEASSWCLIVSCDMPFLTENWLKFLLQRAESSAAEVVFPRSGSGFEPLCACWQPRAAETLRRAFERGARKMMDGVREVKAEVLDEKDWKRFDSAGRLFWNMNTPSEYEEARRILEAEGR